MFFVLQCSFVVNVPLFLAQNILYFNLYLELIGETSAVDTRAVEPELRFQAPAPGIKIVWHPLQPLKVFGSGSRMIWSVKD